MKSRQQQQMMYLEVVSVSMKSQSYSLPDQASVLVTTSSPSFNLNKQSKSIGHLSATTSTQWWMFKELYVLPITMRETNKVQIKLYGSGSSSSSSSSASSVLSAENKKANIPLRKEKKEMEKIPLPKGNTSRLEVCIGKLELPLSNLTIDGTAASVELQPVSLLSYHEKEKISSSSSQKHIISSMSLRLLSERPPTPPSKSDEDTVACGEGEGEESDLESESAKDKVLGVVRLVVWQGKELNTDYPVFLHTRINQRNVRRYKTLPVANPHNPIFDTIQEFEIISLQGDLFVTLVTDHSLRANKPLGQVIVPLSWLTKQMAELESKTTISGWFEIFPFNKITKYNGGGKYVPYMKDIPLSSGIDNCIGLSRPDKPIGFVKIDVTLQLNRSLLRTLLLNPFCVQEKPSQSHVDDDDAADLFDIYVTKHNFYRIMDTLTNPLWFKTFKDIIRWRHHWGVTFFALFLFGYTCLIADVWMYPFLIMVFVVFVGMVASYERHFHVEKLFVDEKEELNKLQRVDEGNSKSLAEKYKAMKQSVHKMEQRVRLLASQVEKMNNLLLWSDPTLSITALFFIVMATLAASTVLSIIPPNICMFMGGLVVFIPQEGMGYLKKMKRISKLLMQKLKASYAIRYDTKLPEGTFLPQLNHSHLIESMTGHILSGDLYSQTWSGKAPQGMAAQWSQVEWTRKWCELWAVPGVLKISDEMTYDISEKPPIVCDVTYVIAKYIGKSSKNNSKGNTKVDKEGSTNSGSDDLYLFEILFLKGKKAEKLKQLVWPNYETKGWVFGCSSYGDAQTWIKAINKVTNRVSFQSILSGEDFRNPFSKRRNRGMVTMMVKTFWRWVMLVPDNLELQHRHFCEQAYVRSKFRMHKSASPLAKSGENLTNNDMDIMRVSGKKAGYTDATRYLTVGHDINGIPEEYTLDPTGLRSQSMGSITGIHVSLFRARGLQVKNSESKAKGWLLATTIPKIYVNLCLSAKEECSLMLRTGGQPRTHDPVFREDFVFPNVSYEGLSEKKAHLQLEVSLRTPMAFGLSSDSVQILGRIQVPLQPWLEMKLKEEEADDEDREGIISANRERVLELEEEKWYNLISHTFVVGEVKLQISCL